MPGDRVPEVYVDLAKRFLNGEVTAGDFSLAVVREYKREETFFRDATAQAMDKLFYAAEGYCDDPEIRDEDDFDELQLADAARGILAFVDTQSHNND